MKILREIAALLRGGRTERRCRRPHSRARAEYAEMVAAHAREANGVPEALVHRVIMRESRYRSRAWSAMAAPSG